MDKKGQRVEGERKENKEKEDLMDHQEDVWCIVYSLGKDRCPSITIGAMAKVLYEGRVASEYYENHGGGANYLCLPEDHEYLSTIYKDSQAFLYGMESESLILQSVSQNENIP